MNKQEYLNVVRKQIHFFLDRDSIEEELSSHLSESIADLMDEGLPKDEAEQLAVKQMGDPIEVGKQLNQEHHPVLGYLWLASNVVLALLAVPTIVTLISFAYGAYNMLTPAVMGNAVEIVSVNYERITPTHRIQIDNVCVNEEGRYYLTYRAWTNWEYSRAGWSTDSIRVINDDGTYLGGSSYSSSSFLGKYGYTSFEMPSDGIINVIFRDGEIVELELEGFK
ncbi:MAG: hypothetical protein IKM20_03075 [Erysipelotrichales bacterium]|nr:hypothetical protein [Erysipelotrichales bacterium]